MKLVMRYNAGDESVGNIDVTLPIEHESVDSAELVFLTLCELNMKDGHIGSFIFKGLIILIQHLILLLLESII